MEWALRTWRRAGRVLVIVVATGCNGGASDRQLNSATAKALPSTPPLALLRRDVGGGMPYQTPVGGFVFALWEDGTLVRSACHGGAGEPYVRGRVPPEILAELIPTIQDAAEAMSSRTVPYGAVGYVLKRRVAAGKDGRKRWVWAFAPANKRNLLVAGLHVFVLGLELDDAEPIERPRVDAVRKWFSARD